MAKLTKRQKAYAAKIEAGKLDASATGEISAAYKSVSKKVMRTRVLEAKRREIIQIIKGAGENRASSSGQ